MLTSQRTAWLLKRQWHTHTLILCVLMQLPLATTMWHSPEFLSHELFMIMVLILLLRCPASKFSACCHQDFVGHHNNYVPLTFEICWYERHNDDRKHEMAWSSYFLFLFSLAVRWWTAANDQILNEDDFDDKTSWHLICWFPPSLLSPRSFGVSMSVINQRLRWGNRSSFSSFPICIALVGLPNWFLPC